MDSAAVPVPVSPRLSVVFVTALDDDESVGAMLRALAGQTVARHLEVVVVTQEGADVDLPAEHTASLEAVRVVRCSPRSLFGEALLQGVHASTAPIVALIEDHSTPDPHWAEALLTRHRDGYAVVGSELQNANPDSALSWANFALAHHRWSWPAREGEVDTVAGDNCSYERAALLSAGPDLDMLLNSGTVLHQRLRRAGHRIYLEPRARLVHITPSTLSATLESFFYSAWLFIGLQAIAWPWWRRVLWAAASPAIAVRWVLGVASGVTTGTVGPRVARVRALMLLVIPAAAMGYALGALLGASGSARRTSDIYFHRPQHLQDVDHARVAEIRGSRTPQ